MYVRSMRLIQKHGEFAEHRTRLGDPSDLNAFLYDRDFVSLRITGSRARIQRHRRSSAKRRRIGVKSNWR
jgi:hypothetical protein